MRLLTLPLMCMMLLCACAALCQDASQSPSVQQHPEDSGAKSQNPSSQPKTTLPSLTQSLSGNWATSVKFEPSPDMPNGFSGTGAANWRTAAGGITLLEEERMPSPAGDMFLLGIIWWDSKTNSLHGMECNNQLPYVCDLKGGLNDITMSWDGKQFAIDEIETHNGKKTLWHEVWTDITPNSFTQTGDVSEPGGSPKRVMTIHATRAADNAK